MIKYRSILLKLSGEMLGVRDKNNLDMGRMAHMVQEIRGAQERGCQIAIVVGGGNLWRGQYAGDLGIASSTGDQMGMLATLMNAIALREVLERGGVEAHVMSRLELPAFCESYHIQRAKAYLERGKILILGGGTGNTTFTTDTAASLSAIELGVDILIKATKVDGIYSKDPAVYEDAVLYKKLSLEEAIQKNLGVMDGAALHLCREHGIPIGVYNARQSGLLAALVEGKAVGSLITVS